jgi:hypothetical protein
LPIFSKCMLVACDPSRSQREGTMVALLVQLLKSQLIAGDLNVMKVSSTVRDAGGANCQSVHSSAESRCHETQAMPRQGPRTRLYARRRYVILQAEISEDQFQEGAQTYFRR